MAFFDFQGAYFAFNDGSTLRDISAQILAVEGLPGQTDERERTAMADTTGRRFDYGLQNTTFTIEFMGSDGATEALTLLTGARDNKAIRAFERGPEGNDTGDIKFSGNALVLAVQETGRVNQDITYRATLRVDGGVTKGTFA